MAFGTFGLKGFGEVELRSTESDELSNTIVKRKKELDDFSNDLLNIVIDSVNIELNNSDTSNKKSLMEDILKIISTMTSTENKIHLSLAEKQKIANSIMDEIYGYGPITPLLNDASISEVMVNGVRDVYVEKAGKIEKSEVAFRDERHIMHIIEKIIAPIGRRVDESSPMVDGRLPDGSRVNIIIPPLSLKGPTITIRKFAADPFTVEDLISFGTFNHDMVTLLRGCVKGKINIIISGGTGSGKTTLLNVISSFVPYNERIVTIEDAAELQLKQDHVVTLESRPANVEGKGKITIRDLVVNSLRMRPDRIIVGEVRSGEALDMLQAMNTGHDGSLTTIHANNTRDSLSRLETMVMMSGMELPSRAIREQIASAINIIVQIVRFPDGSRKVINISEITGMEGETISMQDIYVFKQDGYDEMGNIRGKHVPTGVVPVCLKRIRAMGENIPSSVFKSSFSNDNWRA